MLQHYFTIVQLSKLVLAEPLIDITTYRAVKSPPEQGLLSGGFDRFPTVNGNPAMVELLNSFVPPYDPDFELVPTT